MQADLGCIRSLGRNEIGNDVRELQRGVSFPAELAERACKERRIALDDGEKTFNLFPAKERIRCEDLVEPCLNLPSRMGDTHLRAEPVLCVVPHKAIVVPQRTQLSSVCLSLCHIRDRDGD